MNLLSRTVAIAAGAVICPAIALAGSDNVRSVRNPAPVVSFDIYTAGPDGALSPPPGTAPRSSRLDENGVYATVINGKEYRHISTIASQASNMQASDLDIDRELTQTPTTPPSSEKALIWLEQNAIEIQGNAVVWHYTFDHTFNTIVIKAGWPSAFSQADVIKALILAHRRTGKERYRDLALRAAYAFTIPCERGGLRCEVGGIPWFEEVPVPYGYAPMILNGHLFAVVMLHRLWQETGDPRVKEAFDDGVASAKTMLLRYDTGYWSQYQIRPRALNILFFISPSSADTQLIKATISSPFTAESSISLLPNGGKTFPGNASWQGAPTISGSPNAGTTFVQLLPGRFAVDHDPVNFRGFDVNIHYKSAGCVPVRIGTYDWRSPSNNWMAFSNVRVERADEECVASARLSNSLTQFSQIDIFYHNWHTRLVSELWRITGEAKFYSTAVRWHSYLAIKARQDASKPDGVIFDPSFEVIDSPEDDKIIKVALQGQDPGVLSEEEMRRRLSNYADSNFLSRDRLAALLSRIGLQF